MQTGEIPNQSGKQYRVEVDDDASFAGTLIDTAWSTRRPTPRPKDLYPEGTLYWRVQAVDTTTTAWRGPTCRPSPSRAHR